MPYCTSCGKPVEPASNFCIDCGKPISGPTFALVAQNPDIYTYFRSQGSFRWSIFANDNTQFESDWQSLSAAQRVDPNLLREFSARFSDWQAVQNKFGFPEVNSYFAIAKEAAWTGQGPPARWLPIHRAWEPYSQAKSAVTEQLLLRHPAAEFCSVRRRGMVNDPMYFALCRKSIWSSFEWLEPKRWLENAEKVLGPQKDSIGEAAKRTIPPDVQTEVWRRDMGKCVKCGSNERLEFDHIIPFARGGSNTTRNIQLLCEPCNRRKAAQI